MGRDMDHDTRNEFEEVDRGVYTGAQCRCRHCGKQLTLQIPKMRHHLEGCHAYSNHRLAIRSGETSSTTMHAHVDRCDAAKQKKLDMLLGYTIFAGGLPFSTFDKWAKPDAWALLHELNSAYKIPERHTVATSLLPACFAEVQGQVQSFLSDVALLNFVTDESDDKSRRRIANLSVTTPAHGSFYLRNFHIEDNSQTAEYLKELIAPEVLNACNGDLSRCNSICTDTCSTMRSLHEKMAADPQFANTFFVLYDSHSIQLLIKRILELPQFNTILKQAQCIAACFSKSRLQLGILRTKQQQLMHGKTFAITLSVITPWGTQYGLFYSLKRSKDALKAYAIDTRSSLTFSKTPNSQSKTSVKEWLLSHAFWNNIDDMLEVLTPLHEAQKTSEADNAHLGHVSDRWLTMKVVLQELYDRNPLPGLHDVIKPDGIWAELYHQQTTDIHWVAHALDPAHAADQLLPSTQIQVLTFMRRYIHVDEDQWAGILQHFFDFKSKEGLFNRQDPFNIWQPNLIANPRLFWSYCRSKSPFLATFAFRIYSIPANSVPSERAFSAMNYIIDKFRASTGVERSNEAIYIYMNRRALRRATKEARGLHDLTDNEAVQLEDDLMAIMEAKEEVVE